MCTFAVVWEGEFQSFIVAVRRAASVNQLLSAILLTSATNAFSPILDALSNK